MVGKVLTVLDFEKYLQGTEDQIGGWRGKKAKLGPPAVPFLTPFLVGSILK